jgi:tRNA threonylcarbamoyladenosine biosynthesis protein TsaE
MNDQPLVLISRSLADTSKIALIIANLLEAGAVLLLNGDMGSGKTAFVKGLALGLNINTTVTSPTFTLVDEYDQGKFALYHMDLYRLNHQEVKDLHLQEYWRGIDFPLGVVAIEWAERLQILPEDYLSLNFSRLIDGDRREIKIMAKGEQYLKITSNQSLLNFCSRD